MPTLHKLFQGSPQGAKISLQLGPALETLSKLACGTGVIRLVFIDADKQEYVQYFHLLLDLLRLPLTGSSALTIHCSGSLICRSPSELGTEKRSPSSTALKNDPRVEQVLPVRDGLTIIRSSSRVKRSRGSSEPLW